MPRIYLRLALIPIALFTLVLILLHAQPYNDHELRELLLPEGCSAPCFLGIKPRETTVDEAIKLLQASKWIEKIEDHSTDLGMIIWYWSNQSPFSWTKGKSAAFSTINGYVDTIILNTGFRLWEIRLVLGVPDLEFVNADKSPTRQYVNYWGGYRQSGVVLLGSQPCNAIQPLLQKVSITMQWVSKSSTWNDHSFGDSLDDMFHVC